MKKPGNTTMTFLEAAERSARIRELYHALEAGNHGEPWSKREDVIGFLYDVGALGRLVMESDGRWVRQVDSSRQLEEKLSECLWWLFALADRLEIDLNRIFPEKLEELESGLNQSLAKAQVKKFAPGPKASPARKSAGKKNAASPDAAPRRKSRR